MMKKETTDRYSPAEEVVSSIIHGAGAALGITALAVLVTLGVRQKDAWKVAAFAVYGVSVTVLYLSSTFYHTIRRPRWKGVLRYLDHSAIFLLIAGTYTPFLLVKLRNVWGWLLFGTIWGLAVLGITLNFSLMGRSGWLSTGVYIAMGWLAVVAIKPLLAAVTAAGIAWLLAGGLSYTLGVFFYVRKGVPYNHAVWHLFVLGGSVCHFIAILLYVLPE